MPKGRAWAIERSITSRGMPRAQYEVLRNAWMASRSSRAGSVLIVKPSRCHSWGMRSSREKAVSERSALRVSGPVSPPPPGPSPAPHRRKPRAGLHVLERSQWVPAKTYEAFAYFTDPASFAALAPSWLQFRLLSPRTLELQEGAEVDYEYALHGIAVRCRARVKECKPSVVLAHEQVAGP